jgi:hypothetical protein
MKIINSFILIFSCCFINISDANAENKIMELTSELLYPYIKKGGEVMLSKVQDWLVNNKDKPLTNENIKYFQGYLSLLPPSVYDASSTFNSSDSF